MNDPFHDQVPHMVPATPDWQIGRGEVIALLICAALAFVSIVMLLP